ncbi:MAG: YcgN family cysteine cluster protein [Beijerinckiaceae bacterium]
MEATAKPFWETTTLDDMTPGEWESLCDGCGRCCLLKLEDEDTGELYHTDVACALFDAGNCRCSDYPNRSKRMPDCVTLTPADVRNLRWLPPTCAYRRINEGRGLAWWHPLVSGDPQTVEKAGVSVKGRVHAREDQVTVSEMKRRIRAWPNRDVDGKQKPI